MKPQTTDNPIRIIQERLGERSLVVIGLMGAGKSAIGRTVAARLALPFVDADTEIEEAAKQTIAEIFETYGEDEFRRAEEKVIERILGGGPQVLATGGGAYMNANTRANIASKGISLWLSADLDLLMARVSRKSTRPLLQQPDPRGVMEKLMEQRYPIYGQADIEVQSRDVTKDEMASAVIEAFAQHMLNESTKQ